MKAVRLLHDRDERRRKELVGEHKPEAEPGELAPSTRYMKTTDEGGSAAASSDCGLLPARATTARERSRSSFERTPGVEGAAVVDEPDTYYLTTATHVPVDHAPGSMRGHLEVRDQRAPMFDGDGGGDG